MKAHDWFIEHRTEYAARILEAEDEAAFREHLARCPECDAEVRQVEEELGLLPMGVTPVTLRPGLRRRIVDHALGIRPARMGGRWIAMAATIALLCGVIGWMAGSRYGAPVATISGSKIIQGSLVLDGKEGGVVIFADSTTHQWQVVMHGLPAAPPGMRYTFWFITREEGMVRDKDVPFDALNPAIFTTSMPDQGHVIGGAVTLEPAGSVSGPPQGKHLIHLML